MFRQINRFSVKAALNAAVLAVAIATLASSALAANIGVYFGTFDPPHRGHAAVAMEAIEKLGLDRLYILPNYSPVGKPGATSFDTRLEMVELYAARDRRLTTLHGSEFEKAYAEDPADYISVIMDRIRARHGKEDRLFHVCGTDSFNKMAEYGKLPTAKENRVVAVVRRRGYETDPGAAGSDAVRLGKVIFIDSNIEEASSTAIRRAIISEDQRVLTKLDGFILDYIARNGLYGFKRTSPALSAMARTGMEGYAFSPAREEKTVSSSDFSMTGLPASMVGAAGEVPTLDIDSYLAGKIPGAVRDLITRHDARVTLIAGLDSDAVAFTRKLSNAPMYRFAPLRDRIGLVYYFGYREGKPWIIVTNTFGMDRLTHTALEYAFLFSKNDLPVDRLEIYAREGHRELAAKLCGSSLSGISHEIGKFHAFIGYQGAFNHLVSDIVLYMRENPDASLGSLRVETLDAFIAGRKREVLSPDYLGSEHYPFRRYRIPTGRGKFVDVASFRNHYGDQTGELISELVARGAASVTIFGNAGAVGESVKIGGIYAPTESVRDREAVSFINLAAANYPPVRAVKVSSILEETWPWLEAARRLGADVVDVENLDVAKTVRIYDLPIRYAVLVTDRPGVSDITTKNEDSPQALLAKRKFFLETLKELVGRKNTGDTGRPISDKAR